MCPGWGRALPCLSFPTELGTVCSAPPLAQILPENVMSLAPRGAGLAAVLSAELFGVFQGRLADTCPPGLGRGDPFVLPQNPG